VPEESAEAGRDWLDAAPSLKGSRVLVVDDAADAREVLGEILRRCGAEVDLAESVPVALRALERALPDVVVADIEMPDEDGYDLLRKIRARPIDGRDPIPVVALTAYASEQDRRSVLDAGFTTHLAKPASPLEVVGIVARLVRSISRNG
jgi:CheY-like chemotaxis protein